MTAPPLTNVTTQSAAPHARRQFKSSMTHMLVLTVIGVLSPAAGLAVELALAWRFGASGLVDGFRAVSVIYIMGTQFLLAALLPHVLIPLYAKTRTNYSERTSSVLTLTVGSFLAIPALLFAFAALMWPSFVIDLVAPGASLEARSAALSLLPFVSIATMVAAGAGVVQITLHTYGIFWVNGVAQLAANVCIVVSLLMVATNGLRAIALGLVGGVVVNLILSVAYYRRALGSGTLQRAALTRTNIVHAVRPTVVVTCAALVAQVNVLLLMRALSLLPTGGMAVWGYAWKMLQLVTIAPLALSVVAFPILARANINGDTHDVATRTARSVLHLSTVAAGLLFILAAPLTVVMFGRGALTAGELHIVASLLALLALTAPLNALIPYYTKVVFASGQPIVSLLGHAMYAVLAVLTLEWSARQYGLTGVALAAAACSLVNLVALFIGVGHHRRPFWPFWVKCLREVTVTVAAAGIARVIIVMGSSSTIDMPAMSYILALTIFCASVRRPLLAAFRARSAPHVRNGRH